MRAGYSPMYGASEPRCRSREIRSTIESGRGTGGVFACDAEDDHVAEIVALLSDGRGGGSVLVRDQIHLVGQLCAFGISAAQIARRTRSDRKDVDAAICVASCKLAVRAVSEFEFLTLDQAAAVAQFDDDRLAMSALIIAAGRNPAQFDEVVQQHQRRARLDRVPTNRDQSVRVKITAARVPSFRG